MPADLSQELESLSTITARIVSILKERGPMTIHAMLYFLNSSTDFPYLSESSIKYALRVNKGDAIAWSRDTSALLTLVDNPDKKPRLPSFIFEKDYVQAYYQLLARVQEYKKHPELLSFPDAWSDAILDGSL